ncbi:MAG: nitroreductase family protein [Planctomycetota bacterium]
MTAEPINPTRRELFSPLSQRYSPYRYEPRSIAESDLASCFEAACWAASSFNEQPWRFVVASREQTEEFERMLGCLLEANRGWAQNAGALILTTYRSKFSRNDKPNRVALHDLGQASAHFALQAASLGLQVHQMAGINVSQIRAEYQIPEAFEPATAIAVGYPDQSPPDHETAAEWARREASARSRKSLSDVVFSRQWENAGPWS